MTGFLDQHRLIGFQLLDTLFIRLDHRLAIRLNQPIHQLLDFIVQLAYLVLHRLPALCNLRLPVTPPCFEHFGGNFE
ncbi:MAG: hypothetical protein LZF64_07310 [Nitrosomonas sp.]|nr:MAG: hypothetical protein LZF64_07310 [Nitrosomonas sp.]UJP07082.1 MAG: hypothetical protein LZF84_08485 [Nitrosomonas sp.]